MHELTDSQRHRYAERMDVAFALMVVQATLGFVALAGLLVVAVVAGFPALTLPGLLVLLGALVPALLAAGIGRQQHWASSATIVYETALLVSVFLNRMLDALPQVQMNLTLTGLLTGVCLPVALIVLVRVPAAAPVPQRPSVTPQPHGSTSVPMRSPGARTTTAI